ncbi:MAG: hypothetical protein H7346_25055 [Burkholderiaceae bacterium]|nr:hypothetical protein [Burkholderiaceae bacterium]
MKSFQYPLARLKQIRDVEMQAGVSAVHALQQAIDGVEQQINEKIQETRTVWQTLQETERKQGRLQLDMRRLSGLYVRSLHIAQIQLQQQREGLEQEQAVAHEALLQKRQSVRMLERHEQRLSDDFHTAREKAVQRRGDDAWLARLSTGRH